MPKQSRKKVVYDKLPEEEWRAIQRRREQPVMDNIQRYEAWLATQPRELAVAVQPRPRGRNAIQRAYDNGHPGISGVAWEMTPKTGQQLFRSLQGAVQELAPKSVADGLLRYRVPIAALLAFSARVASQGGAVQPADMARLLEDLRTGHTYHNTVSDALTGLGNALRPFDTSVSTLLSNLAHMAAYTQYMKPIHAAQQLVPYEAMSTAVGLSSQAASRNAALAELAFDVSQHPVMQLPSPSTFQDVMDAVPTSVADLAKKAASAAYGAALPLPALGLAHEVTMGNTDLASTAGRYWQKRVQGVTVPQAEVMGYVASKVPIVKKVKEAASRVLPSIAAVGRAVVDTIKAGTQAVDGAAQGAYKMIADARADAAADTQYRNTIEELFGNTPGPTFGPEPKPHIRGRDTTEELFGDPANRDASGIHYDFLRPTPAPGPTFGPEPKPRIRGRDTVEELFGGPANRDASGVHSDFLRPTPAPGPTFGPEPKPRIRGRD